MQKILIFVCDFLIIWIRLSLVNLKYIQTNFFFLKKREIYNKVKQLPFHVYENWKNYYLSKRKLGKLWCPLLT